jgi:signal transduction histidine kinase
MITTSAELILANKKLIVQFKAMDKLTNQLIKVNQKLAFQNAEREKRVVELAFQRNEKVKRAAELLDANKELVIQNKEKNRLASELLIVNKELAIQNKEKERRASELFIANKELSFQNIEKVKRAAELSIANDEIKENKESQSKNIITLQKMMFMISHELRHPVVQILGLADLLETLKNSPEEAAEMAGLILKSAETLDKYSRELTAFVHKAELKAKNDLKG